LRRPLRIEVATHWLYVGTLALSLFLSHKSFRIKKLRRKARVPTAYFGWHSRFFGTLAPGKGPREPPLNDRCHGRCHLFLFPGNDPQIHGVLALDSHMVLGFQGHLLLRLRAFHVKVVRDNTRARFELFELRHEPDVQIRQ
jgi:hypothetical protein